MLQGLLAGGGIELSVIMQLTTFKTTERRFIRRVRDFAGTLTLGPKLARRDGFSGLFASSRVEVPGVYTPGEDSNDFDGQQDTWPDQLVWVPKTAGLRSWMERYVARWGDRPEFTRVIYDAGVYQFYREPEDTDFFVLRPWQEDNTLSVERLMQLAQGRDVVLPKTNTGTSYFMYIKSAQQRAELAVWLDSKLQES